MLDVATHRRCSSSVFGGFFEGGASCEELEGLCIASTSIPRQPHPPMSVWSSAVACTPSAACTCGIIPGSPTEACIPFAENTYMLTADSQALRGSIVPICFSFALHDVPKQKEGIGALATGLGPTVVGYFIQGFFKFGGVEIIKVKATERLGTRKVRTLWCWWLLLLWMLDCCRGFCWCWCPW